MRGMALLLVLAQRDQSQNFPADCQTYFDEPGYASRPVMADLQARYPTHLLIRSILRTFPTRGSLPESSAVMARANHTTPSICQWQYFRHLVILYHLNRSNVYGVVQGFPRLPLRPTFSSSRHNHPAMLRRRYLTFFVYVYS